MIRERSIWMLVTFVLVLVILYLSQCRGSGKRIEIRESVKRDTVYHTVRDTTIWKVPVVKTLILRDTVEDIMLIPQPIDTAFLMFDYYLTRYYEDTTRLRDGYIVTKDSVRENRITARQVESNLSIPTIHETITIQSPQKTQVYLGLGLISGKQDFIHAFEGSLSLKNKADQIYSLGAVMQTNGQLFYKAGVMFKLSFKKKAR